MDYMINIILIIKDTYKKFIFTQTPCFSLTNILLNISIANNIFVSKVGQF